MNKIKAIILSNELLNDHNLWIKACEENNDRIEFRIVNLTSNSWLEEIQSKPFDILLAKPGGLTAPFKQLYDERIYILNRVLNYRIYPSIDEILVYENKRFLSFWLKANNISHPSTNVFYHFKEATEFIKNATLPLVGKTNIGASGSGVIVLHTKEEAEAYITNTFEGKGAKKRIGPNLSKGGLFVRGLHYVLHPSDIKNKLAIYSAHKKDNQIGFVILQEYIQHDYEWRIVRIGDSFFAHKKLKIGEKASGSLLKGYENPPLDLLNFVKEITDKYQLQSQAMDIFESKNGYLVNEMQCIFGQSDSYQMLVDGKRGRYRYLDNKWDFEQGDFNKNESYNLRLDHIISLFQKQ